MKSKMGIKTAIICFLAIMTTPHAFGQTFTAYTIKATICLTDSVFVDWWWVETVAKVTAIESFPAGHTYKLEATVQQLSFCAGAWSEVKSGDVTFTSLSAGNSKNALSGKHLGSCEDCFRGWALLFDEASILAGDSTSSHYRECGFEGCFGEICEEQ